MTIKVLGKKPIKKFKVPSKSEKGQFHIVGIWGDGLIDCDCTAGFYKKPCRHKDKVISQLTSFYGGIEEAINYYKSLKKSK